MSGTRGLRWYFSLVCFAVAAALGIVRVVTQPTTPSTLLLAALSSVVMMAVLLTAIGLLNLMRSTAVGRKHPQGVVLNLVVYPNLAAQVREAAAAFGLPAARLGITISVKVDADAVRLFRGSFAPKEVFALPTKYLEDASMARAAQGSWMLDGLRLRFANGAAVAQLDMPLIRSGFALPFVLRRKTLLGLCESVVPFAKSGKAA